MTLIATLPVHGVLAIIGDVMLSRRSAEEDHSPLPTIDSFNVLSPNEEWKVAGVHKKICIINSHLAVAGYLANVSNGLLGAVFLPGHHRSSSELR